MGSAVSRSVDVPSKSDKSDKSTATHGLFSFFALLLLLLLVFLLTYEGLVVLIPKALVLAEATSLQREEAVEDSTKSDAENSLRQNGQLTNGDDEGVDVPLIRTTAGQTSPDNLLSARKAAETQALGGAKSLHSRRHRRQFSAAGHMQTQGLLTKPNTSKFSSSSSFSEGSSSLHHSESFSTDSDDSKPHDEHHATDADALLYSQTYLSASSIRAYKWPHKVDFSKELLKIEFKPFHPMTIEPSPPTEEADEPTREEEKEKKEKREEKPNGDRPVSSPTQSWIVHAVTPGLPTFNFEADGMILLSLGSRLATRMHCPLHHIWTSGVWPTTPHNWSATLATGRSANRSATPYAYNDDGDEDSLIRVSGSSLPSNAEQSSGFSSATNVPPPPTLLSAVYPPQEAVRHPDLTFIQTSSSVYTFSSPHGPQPFLTVQLDRSIRFPTSSDSKDGIYGLLTISLRLEGTLKSPLFLLGPQRLYCHVTEVNLPLQTGGRKDLLEVLKVPAARRRLTSVDSEVAQSTPTASTMKAVPPVGDTLMSTEEEEQKPQGRTTTKESKVSLQLLPAAGNGSRRGKPHGPTFSGSRIALDFTVHYYLAQTDSLLVMDNGQPVKASSTLFVDNLDHLGLRSHHHHSRRRHKSHSRTDDGRRSKSHMQQEHSTPQGSLKKRKYLFELSRHESAADRRRRTEHDSKAYKEFQKLLREPQARRDMQESVSCGYASSGGSLPRDIHQLISRVTGYVRGASSEYSATPKNVSNVTESLPSPSTLTMSTESPAHRPTGEGSRNRVVRWSTLASAVGLHLSTSGYDEEIRNRKQVFAHSSATHRTPDLRDLMPKFTLEVKADPSTRHFDVFMFAPEPSNETLAGSHSRRHRGSKDSRHGHVADKSGQQKGEFSSFAHSAGRRHPPSAEVKQMSLFQRPDAQRLFRMSGQSDVSASSSISNNNSNTHQGDHSANASEDALAPPSPSSNDTPQNAPTASDGSRRPHLREGGNGGGDKGSTEEPELQMHRVLQSTSGGSGEIGREGEEGGGGGSVYEELAKDSIEGELVVRDGGSGTTLYGPVAMKCSYLAIPFKDVLKSSVTAGGQRPSGGVKASSLMFEVKLRSLKHGIIADELSQPLIIKRWVFGYNNTHEDRGRDRAAAIKARSQNVKPRRQQDADKSSSSEADVCPEEMLGLRALDLDYGVFVDKDNVHSDDSAPRMQEFVKEALAESLKVETEDISFCYAKEGSTILAFDAGQDKSDDWTRLLNTPSAEIHQMLQLDPVYPPLVTRELLVLPLNSSSNVSEKTTNEASFAAATAALNVGHEDDMMKIMPSFEFEELPFPVDSSSVQQIDDINVYRHGGENLTTVASSGNRLAPPFDPQRRQFDLYRWAHDLPFWVWGLVAAASLVVALALSALLVIVVLACHRRRRRQKLADNIGDPAAAHEPESLEAGNCKGLRTNTNGAFMLSAKGMEPNGKGGGYPGDYQSGFTTANGSIACPYRSMATDPNLAATGMTYMDLALNNNSDSTRHA